MRKYLIILSVLLLVLPVLSKTNPWGNLNLIFYYDANGQREKVIENLDKIELSALVRGDKQEIVKKLVAFADSKRVQDIVMSKMIYSKVLKNVPEYWHIQNKISDIDDNGLFSNIKGTLSQLFKISKDFNSSYLFLNIFVNSLLYALLFVIFIYSIIMLIKYFMLFANDFLIDSHGDFSFKKVLLLLSLFIWPVLFFSGWAMYPFLIFGVLYKYMSNSEKKSIFTLSIIAIIIVSVFSFNSVLSEHYKSDAFKIDRQLYNGNYDSKNYSRLSNEQKTLYALIEYERNDFGKSLDILNNVDSDYYSDINSILLGNLFYNKYINGSDKDKQNLSKSKDYLLQVLRRDEKNKIVLNNLTLVLLRDQQDENEQKIFDSYVERYPYLSNYKSFVLDLKSPVINKHYLWKKLFLLSENSFNPIKFTTSAIVKLATLPLIYYILIFFLYIKFLHKLFIDIGESTICSKCSKIIKKKTIHKSYQLCEDCHQLFLIKDVIFLEAKLLKENEIKKKNFQGFIKKTILSIVIPGLNFNYRDKTNLFLILSMFLYFFIIFGYTGIASFNSLGLPVPFAFYISGFISSALYLVLNITSIMGEDYGV